MGCTSSKLDDLPAVALCRDRCAFLDEAIHQRHALAQAHLAYFHSLKTIGLSLHRFFDRDLEFSAAAVPRSPVLNLPTHRKGDHQPSASPPAAIPHPHHHPHHSHSNSNSGSHLHFNSDSEDDEDDSASDYLHDHSDHDSPNSHNPYGHLNYVDHEILSSYNQGGGGGGGGGGFMNVNYMRNRATPSVVYEQRPMSPDIVQIGDSSSSSYYPYPYNNQIPTTYPPYYNNYPNYDGFFGSSPPTQPPVAPASVASSSKQPPPPPSPPRGSAWDFLNPFETFEKYYPPYTPSRDSKEVREEEGIPDLEDEDFQQEVVKEVHGNQKFVDDRGSGGRDVYSKPALVDDEERKGKGNNNDSELHYGPSSSMEDDEMEYEVHMVDKKVVDKEDKSGHRPNAAAFKGFRDDSEVVKEIQAQFERASELGSELEKMLEIGKHPYTSKHAAYKAVSSKMLNVIAPSLSVVSSDTSTSKSADSSSIEKADPAYLDIDDIVGLSSGNLSSTLQKLLLWEKKLYQEVKVEEKMRVLHERKCIKLKRLDERGAEAHKVDTTRILVRSLSTKIRIAIQIVDKISVKINKLRDDELWPQLNEFIQGLTRMWKSMLECHHSQCQAIREARRLDAIISNKQSSDAHLEATMQLEHELLNWVFSFSCWVGAQKGYVKALNNWLLKCLLYVPEETPDGIVPFSPGRIGAPPVFVVCNQWSQALESISEKEVVETMRDFAASVLQLWERDKQEMRQRMMVNSTMERKVKILEREDQKIHKEIQALDKRIVLASGDGSHLSVTGQMVYQSEASNNTSFQLSMQRIFEAMEKFTASSLRAYEELLQRIEELRLAGEKDKVS